MDNLNLWVAVCSRNTALGCSLKWKKPCHACAVDVIFAYSIQFGFNFCGSTFTSHSLNCCTIDLRHVNRCARRHLNFWSTRCGCVAVKTVKLQGVRYRTYLASLVGRRRPCILVDRCDRPSSPAPEIQAARCRSRPSPRWAGSRARGARCRARACAGVVVAAAAATSAVRRCRERMRSWRRSPGVRCARPTRIRRTSFCQLTQLAHRWLCYTGEQSTVPSYRRRRERRCSPDCPDSCSAITENLTGGVSHLCFIELGLQFAAVTAVKSVTVRGSSPRDFSASFGCKITERRFTFFFFARSAVFDHRWCALAVWREAASLLAINFSNRRIRHWIIVYSFIPSKVTSPTDNYASNDGNFEFLLIPLSVEMKNRRH